MKTVAIGGVCRTGKSRLANKVFQNTKATVFHADYLMNLLNNNFPDSVKDRFPKVLIKLIRNMGKEFNYTRVFESCHVDPVILKSKLNNPNYIFIKSLKNYENMVQSILNVGLINTMTNR